MTTPCPHCKSGRVMVTERNGRGNMEMKWKDCEHCGGSGVVTGYYKEDK